MDWTRFRYISKLVSNPARRNLYIHKLIPRTRASESHQHNEKYRNRNDDNQFKCVQPINIKPVIASVLSLFLLPVNASADVGGVSATSNPVANSSGSATVNAYQVLTGNFINSTFGKNGVICQAETMTISPYVGLNHNIKRPYEKSYKEPVYDMRADDAGNLLDPGGILFEKDILTQQRDNHGASYGLTIQWSKPLDRELQSLCREAGRTEIALRKADLNLRILDYEISRLKHCGTLKKDGISFASHSKYKVICDDIDVAISPYSVPNHSHKINITKEVAKEESVGKQVNRQDIEKPASASTSSEPSAVLGVHELKAPWSSSQDE